MRGESLRANKAKGVQYGSGQGSCAGRLDAVTIKEVRGRTLRSASGTAEESKHPLRPKSAWHRITTQRRGVRRKITWEALSPSDRRSTKKCEWYLRSKRSKTSPKQSERELGTPGKLSSQEEAGLGEEPR